MLRVLLFLAAGSLGAAPWEPFTALALSDDGRYAVTGGLQGEVILWETLTGEVLRRDHLPGDLPVAAVEVDLSGEVAAARLGTSYLVGSELKTLPSADQRSVRLQKRAAGWLQGSPMSGVAARFSDREARGFPDGHIAVQAGPALSWQAHDAAVSGLAWSPDGLVLYSCSFDGGLAKWDSKNGALLGRL